MLNLNKTLVNTGDGCADGGWCVVEKNGEGSIHKLRTAGYYAQMSSIYSKCTRARNNSSSSR